jgi:hypothetical protein
MPMLKVIGGRAEVVTGKEERRADGNLKVKCKTALRIATGRDAVGQAVTIDVKDNDVVALELEGGSNPDPWR